MGSPKDVERDSPRQESEMLKLVGLAQEEILNNGFAVDSKSKVEVHLKPQSLVPSKVSLFSPCLLSSSLYHSYAECLFKLPRTPV